MEINTQDLLASTVAFAPADCIRVDTWANFRPGEGCPLHSFDGYREMLIRLTCAAGPLQASLWTPVVRSILGSPIIFDGEHLEVRRSTGQALKDMDRSVGSGVRMSGFSY